MQTELGQTEGALKGMKTESGKVGGAIKSLGTQFSNLRQQVPALGTAFNLLTNPISLAVAGLGTFVAISRKAIKEIVDYNKQVREMMQLTGLGAEETSRIIQVADDWQIDIGATTSAMELMNKKGITPSIDNLAKIADEYVNATDKSAFMEEATKKYGKSFSNLIPILAKGGKALRDQAAAISDNMLATDESIASTREWEVNLDNLDDTVQGLKYNLSKGLLPTLNNVLETTNELIGTAMEEEAAASRLKKAVNAGTISRKEYNKAMWSLRIGTDAYIDILKDLTYKEVRARQVTEELQEQEDKLIGAHNAAWDATHNLADETDNLTEATYNLAFEQRMAERTSAKLEEAIGRLNTSINSQLGPEIENFNKTQGELNTKMGKIQGEIDQAIRDGYNPLGEKVLDLKGDYDELKDQYTENEKEHDRASHEIMFDMLEQELALGGWTEAEKVALESAAKAWNLPYQATIDYLDKQKEAINYLRDHPEDAAGVVAILDGIESAWGRNRRMALLAREEVDRYGSSIDALDGKEVNTNIRTHYWEVYESGGGGRHASGLDYVIPPGFTNDSFPLGRLGFAKSGERVMIMPDGENFGDALISIRQLINQAIMGLNSRSNKNIPGGNISPQTVRAESPISVIIQGTPEKEMDKRRQARYVAEEIQRRQS